MEHAKRWSVTIDIDEHDGNTRAFARLHTGDTDTLVGEGIARLGPGDDDVPEIGDEIAAARALSDLGHRLIHAATEDVEAVTGEAARLRI